MLKKPVPGRHARLASLPGLRAFEAAARLGSIRDAAAELHVTPGAVSQHVKGLELELGAQLVRRNGTGIALTKLGEVVKGDIIGAFQTLSRVTARIRRGDGPRGLRLRMSDPALAANWLLVRLQHYMARPGSSDVIIETTTGWTAEELADTDLAIRFGLGDYPGFVSHRLFADEVFPVCSPRLLKRKPLRKPGDLAGHALLHHEWSTQFLPWPDWPAWLRAAGVEGVDASHGLRFTDYSLCLQAAVSGQGVALGTSGPVADHLAAGTLVAPFEKSIVTPFAYYLVYPPNVRDRPEARDFIAWILEAASQTEVLPVAASASK